MFVTWIFPFTSGNYALAISAYPTFSMVLSILSWTCFSVIVFRSSWKWYVWKHR